MDADTRETVSGASFRFWQEGKEPAVAADGDDGETDGFTLLEKLSPGVWYFREEKAPEGYELNEGVFSFTVEENGAISGDTEIVVPDPPITPPPVVPTGISLPLRPALLFCTAAGLAGLVLLCGIACSPARKRRIR